MTDPIQRIGAFGDDGYLFSVSGVRYLGSCPKKSRAFPQKSPFFTIFPVPLNGEPITFQWTQQLLAKYNEDDVFSNAFLSTVVFNNTLSNVQHVLDQNAKHLLKSYGAHKIYYFFNLNLAPGPYMNVNGQLWEAWKLVDDSHETCMVTLKPRQNTTSPFERLSIMGQESNVLSVAIPSRLKTTVKYSECNEKFSVAGKRILIKDNIHLNGIRTSNGNRAFDKTYPAQTQTAPCIQDLIDKGAVVIGKTKMSSFENWEEPIQYTDYQAPWNPRADRYQSPGSSSSGSASAIAAYEWLDIAIGTDTLGGVTRPAHWCGCFGLRPSIGSISAEGIEPCVNSWDIPGILARDLEDCEQFAEQWLNFDDEKFNNAPKEFSSIIWPVDFWAEFNPTEMDMSRVFAEKMADELKVRLVEISFKKYWSKYAPKGFRKYPLEEFMKETTRAIAHDKYRNGEDFRTQYKQQNGGEPYTSKPNEEIWSIGKKTCSEDRVTASQRIDVYKSWFKEHVLTGRNNSAIIVLPLDSAGPRYRDDCPDPRDDNPSYDNASDESSSDESSQDESSQDESSQDDSGHDDSSYINTSNINTSIDTSYVGAPYVGTPYIGAPYTGAPYINVFNINNAYINTSYNDYSFEGSVRDQRYRAGRPRYGSGYPGYSIRPTRCLEVRRPEVRRLEFRHPEVRCPEVGCPEVRCLEVRCPEVSCPEDNPQKHNHKHKDNHHKDKQPTDTHQHKDKHQKDKQPKDDRPKCSSRRLHQSGINALTLGPVMEAPVLAVPIGQTRYKSRVNQLEELSPFAVALMGPPGTDIRLIRKVMKVMKSLEKPTKVKTGKLMY
ncbi:amidase signature domain-containing protein [Trichoderma compactum]